MLQNILKLTPIFIMLLLSKYAMADLTVNQMETMISINPTSGDPAKQVSVNITPGQAVRLTVFYDRLNSVDRLSLTKALVQDTFGGSTLIKNLTFPNTERLFYTAHDLTDFLRLYINVYYIGPQETKPKNLSFTCDIYKSKLVQIIGKTTWNKQCTPNPTRFFEI